MCKFELLNCLQIPAAKNPSGIQILILIWTQDSYYLKRKDYQMSKISRLSKVHVVIVLALTVLSMTISASARPWRFGVMADTQWTTPNDGQNPNSVSVGIINQLNSQFINSGVEFVIQVGDLTDNGSIAALDTRAAAAKSLYDAGIEFFPLRGNHESSQAAALHFQQLFPQTQPSGPYATSSPFVTLNGLSYSFDYNNARFVLLDQFSRTDNSRYLNDTNSDIIDQINWINTVLSTRTKGTHAFVFGHKNLIGENHTDVLLGANPGANPDAQNAFIGSLYANNVRYYISGHDHIHQRSVITSPNRLSKVEEIICASDSSKFYIPLANSELPGTVNNDVNFDNPIRETSISQDLYKIGYYIYTVDGPRVTVDYYASESGATNEGGEYLIFQTPRLNFIKKETFGYSLNGKEFIIPQNGSYTVVQDKFSSTTARILEGINRSNAVDGSDRSLSKTVNTGWTPREKYTGNKSKGALDNILSLWGMGDPGKTKTDTFVLAMSYEPKSVYGSNLANGFTGIVTRDSNGNWTNAVNMNYGGSKRLVRGPWRSGYTLGTYGIDTRTSTAWAVINYNADFTIAK